MNIEETVEDLNCKNIYILYSVDPVVRLTGTSGGFVTELNNFLYDKNKIKSSITFVFSGKELFKPHLIYKKENSIQTGSIYHEINLIKFLKDNINKIKSPIFIVCLPCQCKAIKIFLISHNIKFYLVSLICSQQCDKKATYNFLKNQDLDINKIKNLRYRGNGWPSGMQIIEKDGNKHFFPNSGSIWNMYFHSTIYTMKRCFYCKQTFGMSADFSVSDVWIPRYYKDDKIGHSAVCINSNKAEEIINEMKKNKRIKIVEEISPIDFFNSQIEAVKRKRAYKNHIYKTIISIFRTSVYKAFFHKYPKVHYKLNAIIRRLLFRRLKL
jgi:coenzyme F420 hydrogenase subunit beta